MPETSTSRFVSTLEFAALPSAVPCARLHARAVMQEWGLAKVADTVELVVSELVTNAVVASHQAARQLRHERHGDSHGDRQPMYQRRAGLPSVALRLSADYAHVLIEVWDDVPAPPRPKAPSPDDDGGRGLALVDALCERWGYYVPDSQRSKVVWAVVRIEPSPAPARALRRTP